GGDLRLAQAGQFGHVVDQHRRVVDFVEHVVGKLRAQFGQARVDLLQPRLLRGIEPGAGAHEIVVVLLDQAQALGVEAEAGVLAWRCASNVGGFALVISLRRSLVSVPLSLPKMRRALVRSLPDFSRATIVFSNVGSAFWLTIASISCSSCAMPASNAGAKCSS